MLEYILAAPFTAIPFLAIFVAVAIITPSSRWATTVVLVIGLGVALTWIGYWVLPRRNVQDEHIFTTMSLEIVAFLTSGYVFAAIGHVTGLIWWHSTRRN